MNNILDVKRRVKFRKSISGPFIFCAVGLTYFFLWKFLFDGENLVLDLVVLALLSSIVGVVFFFNL